MPRFHLRLYISGVPWSNGLIILLLHMRKFLVPHFDVHQFGRWPMVQASLIHKCLPAWHCAGSRPQLLPELFLELLVAADFCHLPFPRPHLVRQGAGPCRLAMKSQNGPLRGNIQLCAAILLHLLCLRRLKLL